MSLGSRLREARERIGFSQEDVAQRLELHRTTIGKYENNECDPSIDVLSKLIEIYCEDANYILYGKTRKSINVFDLPQPVVQKIYFIIAEYNLSERSELKNIKI